MREASENLHSDLSACVSCMWSGGRNLLRPSTRMSAAIRLHRWTPREATFYSSARGPAPTVASKGGHSTASVHFVGRDRTQLVSSAVAPIASGFDGDPSPFAL